MLRWTLDGHRKDSLPRSAFSDRYHGYIACPRSRKIERALNDRIGASLVRVDFLYQTSASFRERGSK